MIVVAPIAVRILRMDRRAASRNAALACSHLDGIRDRPGRSLTVSAAAITRDDLDPRMLGKPSLHGGRFPVRQQGHDRPSLQITYDCPVTVIPAEGPVIDTHNHQRIGWHHGSSSHDPQQGVVADGQHEWLGKACFRSSAECQAQMMDNALQPRRATRPDRDNMVSEPLGKNLPAAMAASVLSQSLVHVFRRTGTEFVRFETSIDVSKARTCHEEFAKSASCKRHGACFCSRRRHPSFGASIMW